MHRTRLRYKQERNDERGGGGGSGDNDDKHDTNSNPPPAIRDSCSDVVRCRRDRRRRARYHSVGSAR